MRLTGLAVGAVFGVLLSWSGMTSPDVIRGALLFEQSYLFLFFASAVLTAFVGLRVVRALARRSLVTHEPVAWATERPQARHVVGSVIFGVGWGIADACPGPVATQIGQGIGWGLCTLAGMAIGIALYLRRSSVARAPAAAAAPG